MAIYMFIILGFVLLVDLWIFSALVLAKRSDQMMVREDDD
jgi:hypothetical protein